MSISSLGSLQLLGLGRRVGGWCQRAVTAALGHSTAWLSLAQLRAQQNRGSVTLWLHVSVSGASFPGGGWLMGACELCLSSILALLSFAGIGQGHSLGQSEHWRKA